MIYIILLLKTDENKVVNDKYENNEVDYFNFNVIITPNHYVGIKPREILLR